MIQSNAPWRSAWRSSVRWSCTWQHAAWPSLFIAGCTALCVSLLSLLLVGAAPAAPSAASPSASGIASHAATAASAHSSQPLKGNEDEPLVHIVIELNEPSLVDIYLAQQSSTLRAAAATAATQTQLLRVQSAQRALLSTLDGLGAEHIFSTQRVYNGVAVRAPRSSLTRIARLSGVKSIRPLVPKRPLNSLSVPFTGAPAWWDAPVGATGAGRSIAVIDTGIDYLHVALGGPGEGYTQNDSTLIGDGLSYPNAKVVGGIDLTGDRYNADIDARDYQPIPLPDPDPMDCYGHGTHVAATAAGLGVDRNDNPYTGPYTSSIYEDAERFNLGPGVAPEAKLYAVKVFGCTGSSDVVDLGIEWALDPNGDGDLSDRVDVINLSLGSSFGSPDDTTAIAAENAVRMGVVVVASAGNVGDSYYAVSSPSVADGAISVAATADSLPMRFDDSNSSEQTLETLANFSARGPRRHDSQIKPDIAAPGRSIVSAWAGSGAGAYANSGTSMSAPHVAGAAALLLQANPGWTPQQVKARLMNSAVTYIEPAFDDAGDSSALNSTPASVQHGPTRIGAGRLDLARSLAAQSVLHSAEQPDLVSVSFGTPDVMSADAFTHTVVLHNSGAEPISYTLAISSVIDAPGIDFSMPVTEVIALAPGGAITLPVRLEVLPDQLERARDATVDPVQTFPRQWLTEEAGFLMARSSRAAEPTVALPIYAAPRQVSALRASVDEFDVGTQIDVTLPITFNGTSIESSSTVTQVNSLVSPYVLLHEDAPIVPGNGSIEVLNVYAHADLRYVGVSTNWSETRTGSQLQGKVAASTVYFGISTYGERSSPNEVMFSLFIDTNGDGVEDYRLYNSDQEGFDNRFAVSDAFITVVENLQTGEESSELFINSASAANVDTAIFNTEVMILPVRGASLGLSNSNPDFTFRIESESVDSPLPNETIDETPTLYYSVNRPGLEFSGDSYMPLFDDTTDGWIDVRFQMGDYAWINGQGMLFFHHHNTTGRRAEVIDWVFEWPRSLHLPLLHNQR